MANEKGNPKNIIEDDKDYEDAKKAWSLLEEIGARSDMFHE